MNALITLNNADAEALSWLEPDRFGRLIDQAYRASRLGEEAVEALLLAFDQDADYDSPNFLWFRARYPQFIYVDRIVVAAEARGRGHARRLYDDLFEKARTSGHHWIVCEVNSNPPNPGSDAFHAKLGFVAVGSASLSEGGKTVRYLAKAI